MHPLVIKSYKILHFSRTATCTNFLRMYTVYTVCNRYAMLRTQLAILACSSCIVTTSSPRDEKPVFFFYIFLSWGLPCSSLANKNSLHVFFWSKFSRQMRVYQAHISQNKLEIAHLQLDLDWCNRRLLRIMGVAGSRKGKGSSKFCRKEAQPFWNAVGICWMCVVLKSWNLLCRICRSAVNFCAVPCVIRGEVWAPGIDQHWKVLRNGARSYKLRRGHHSSHFRWRWLTLW